MECRLFIVVNNGLFAANGDMKIEIMERWAVRMIKNGIYQHYKGNLYEVLGEATHSESLEMMVVYQALYGDFGLWVRPKKMFLEKVLYKGKEISRFCYQESISDK